MRLEYLPYDDIALKVQEIMTNEAGIKEIFQWKIDRLMASTYTYLIVDDNENEIGFINLVNDNVIDNALSLDMGIKQKYRGKGFGHKAIDTLIDSLKKDNYKGYVIAETRKNNGNANGLALDKAALILEEETFNFYLFPKEKLEDFKNDGTYDRFRKVIEGNQKIKRI